MAKTGTYALIASNTLGSAASTITFNSIPGTYTDLIIILSGKTTVATEDIEIRFNSDTTTNYSQTSLTGDGTSATSARRTSVDNIRLNGGRGYWDTTTVSNNVVSILDYANTTTYKTVLSRANNTANGLSAIVGLWRKTPEAITTITLAPTFAASDQFAAGSTFYLYGIQAGNA